MTGVAVWRGTFGAAQAERLLWRAGFGPRPGETHDEKGRVHDLLLDMTKDPAKLLWLNGSDNS